MSDSKKKKTCKKVNQLKLAECEKIINQMGGQMACTYVQHVMDQYQRLQAARQLSK